MSELEYRKLSCLLLPPISGSRPSGGVRQETDGIPSLGGENVTQAGGMSYQEVRKIPKEYFDLIAKCHLRNEDVLINKDGAQTGKIGLYEGDFHQAAINEHLFILRAKNACELSQIYLYYSLLLSETQSKIQARITGSAQPGLNSSFVKAVDVPFHAPTEQKKIASCLRFMDSLINKTATIIAKYQRIKDGLMRDLFTRGVTEDGKLRPPRDQAPDLYKETPIGWVPQEWAVKPISSSKVEIIDGDRGENYPQAEDFSSEGFCLFLSTANVSKLGWRFEFTQWINEERDRRLGTGKLVRDDLVITTRGTVGNIVHYDEAVPYDAVRINSGMVLLRNHEDGFSTKFLFYSLRDFLFEKGRQKAFSGSAQPQLPIKDLKKFQLLIPQPHEQQQISKIIYSIDELQNAERCLLSKLRRQKSGLMHDLLTGKKSVDNIVLDPPESSHV